MVMNDLVPKCIYNVVSLLRHLLWTLSTSNV